MKTTLLAPLLLAGVPLLSAAEPALTAAERDRARSIPHHATAGVRLPDGSVAYGALVIAAHDDGRVRVELSAAGGVQAEMALAAPDMAHGGSLRSRFRAPAGPASRYANHGTLAVPGRGRAVHVVGSDLRMDADGLFVLDLEGADAGGAPVALAAFGRVIGTCWKDDAGTLKRVADLTQRPDCLRLFGGL
jgi:hypothetical protein